MLKRLAALERGLLQSASSQAPVSHREKFGAVTEACPKHIYLVLGEPRTGKTSLASLAGISRAVMHVDTDAYPDELGLFKGLEDRLDEFHGDPGLRVCFVTVGRYRESNAAVTAAVVERRKIGANVTVCRLEKID